MAYIMAVAALLCAADALERAKAQTAESRQRFEAAVAERKTDRATATLLLSAHQCGLLHRRRAEVQEIKTEQRYAGIGGAVDLVKMHAIQDHIRAIDEERAELASIVKTTGLSLRNCADRRVAALERCRPLRIRRQVGERLVRLEWPPADDDGCRSGEIPLLLALDEELFSEKRE